MITAARTMTSIFASTIVFFAALTTTLQASAETIAIIGTGNVASVIRIVLK